MTALETWPATDTNAARPNSDGHSSRFASQCLLVAAPLSSNRVADLAADLVRAGQRFRSGRVA